MEEGGGGGEKKDIYRSWEQTLKQAVYRRSKDPKRGSDGR